MLIETEGEIINSQIILDGIIWSFSSVNTYSKCPQMFKLTYIDCLSKVENAFAEWGTWGHKILELFYRGKLELFELKEVYEQEYNNNVKIKFPPSIYSNLNTSYHNAGIEYFNTFEDPFKDYIILGIEQEIHIKIGKYDFIGYIDLILQDKNGNIVLVDHKSKSKFKSKKEKSEYLHQLYLYSQYIFDTYGKYPSKLIFNMFKIQELIEEEFNYNDFENAKKWFIDTIDTIYKDQDFNSNPSTYFCDYICGVRCWCKNSKDYLGV